MNKIKVRLNEKLQRGTLLWINASNHKVYRSSKRFDTASFSDHDSNYVGELEEVIAWTGLQKESIYNELKVADRLYGICLHNETVIPSTQNALSEKVILFSTWDKMLAFAKKHFTTLDDAIARKEAMKKKWKEKGRQHVQNKQQHIAED